MKKLIKIATILLLLAACQGAFAGDWYICLGSFKNKSNAQQRAKLLTDNHISNFIYEYKKSASETLFRVVMDEPLKTEMDAVIRRRQVNKMDAISKLNIQGVWYFEMPGPSKLQPESKAPSVTPVQKSEAPVIPAPVVEQKQKTAEVEIEEAVPVNEELANNRRKITIKDSDTGRPISEADIKIDEKWDTASDVDGIAPIPDEVPDGEHELLITKGSEYVPTKTKMILKDGEVATAPQISVPKAVDFDRIKIVLDWGETPYDLDTHVIHNRYHVYFCDMNLDGINLDRDDTSSYGPETITIRDVDLSSPYKYYVYNYSDSYRYGTSLSYSEARVRLFFNNEQVGEYKITPGAVGCTWHVFDIEEGNTVKVYDEVLKLYPGEDISDYENNSGDSTETVEEAPRENTEHSSVTEVEESAEIITETGRTESSAALPETAAAPVIEEAEVNAEEKTEVEVETEEADDQLRDLVNGIIEALAKDSEILPEEEFDPYKPAEEPFDEEKAQVILNYSGYNYGMSGAVEVEEIPASSPFYETENIDIE